MTPRQPGRRAFAALLLTLPGLAQAAPARPARPALLPLPEARRRLAEIEARVHGRLGLAAVVDGSTRRLAYRADERFPLCSTFKLLLAGQVLSRIDRRQAEPADLLRLTEADLLPNSPASRAALPVGAMTVEAAAEAIVTVSDNTAANLLLSTVGGPEGFTRWLRDTGDRTTRLDRTETALNEARRGDVRDTTTPAAMLQSMQRLLMGRVLAPAARVKLQGWMEASTTGTHRLRAGLPAAWRVGDKTGANGRDTTNDVALVQRPGRAPILIAAYLTEADGGGAFRDAALAAAAQVVADALGPA